MAGVRGANRPTLACFGSIVLRTLAHNAILASMPTMRRERARPLLQARTLATAPGLRRVMGGPFGSVLVPLAIYLVSRLVDACFLAVGAGRQVALPATTPGYTVIFPTQATPGYFGVMANWDGQWYRSIAENGYPVPLPMEAGHVAMNEWAFYPAYPMLVRIVMFVTGSGFGLSATIVSLACGAAAMVLLYRLLLSTAGPFVAGATVACLCAFATAPALQVGYTESLALLLVVLALTALRQRHYGWLLVVATALSLTRAIVLPLAAVIAIHWLVRWRRRSTADPFPVRERIVAGSAAVTVALLTGLWPAVAGLVTGRADAFVVTQAAWPANQGSQGLLANWFAEAAATPTLGNVLPLLLILATLLLIVARRPAAAWGVELRWWALVYPLYLLAATRPTPSALRYFMLAVVPLWPFPDPIPAGETRSQRTLRWSLLSFLVALGLVGQYLWVTGVFTISESPETQPYP